MTGLRGDQSSLDRFEVSHFAYKDHIWILSERPSKRLSECPGINIDLTLSDKGKLVFMQEFDRILDRNDMAVSCGVYVVDDRRQCGRFTGTGRAGHEDEAPHLVRDRVYHRRQAELVKIQYGVGNYAGNDANGVSLLENIYAETAKARYTVANIDLKNLFEMLFLAVRHH